MSRIASFFKSLVFVPRRRNITIGILLFLIASVIIDMPEPHVSLAAEPLFEEGPAWLTNALITTLIVDIILIVLALVTRSGLKMNPSGFANFMEWVIEGLYNLVESVAGRHARRFFPLAATIFLFVIVSNYSGLIPGVGSIGFTHEGGHGDVAHAEEAAHAEEGEVVHAEEADEGHGEEAHPEEEVADEEHGEQPTDAEIAVKALEAEEEAHGVFVPLFRAPSADLNMTFALSIIVMIMVQVFGVRALGGSYFKKFFNFGGKGFMGVIFAIVGILELISEVAKVISFAFRLFGNIFAGEVLLAVMAFLVAFLLPMPFYGLELFVGFIQALVFMMLAVVFFTTAMISHDDHH